MDEARLDSGLGETTDFVTQRLTQIGAAQRRGSQLANTQPQHLVQLLEDTARLRRIGLERYTRRGEQLRLMVMQVARYPLALAIDRAEHPHAECTHQPL